MRQLKFGLMAFMVGAGFTSLAHAGEVKDSCLEGVAELAVNDAEAGCSCMEEKLPVDAIDAYIAIIDWESEATAEMKEIADQCFPELADGSEEDGA